MKKNSNNAKKWWKTPQNLIIGALVVSQILSITFMLFQYSLYVDLGNRVGARTIGDVYVSANNRLTSLAVREAKTGDTYFPEARLYLPASSVAFDTLKNQQGIFDILYSYYEYDDEPPKLSVTLSSYTSQLEARFAGAPNPDTVFDAFSEIGACRRGVTVFIGAKPAEADELYGTFRKELSLENKQTLYFYADSACDGIDGLVDLLQNLKGVEGL